MAEIAVLLDTIERVKSFVERISRYPNEMEICSERYIVDAKSIMGILSLDLARPLTLRIHGEGAEELAEALGEYRA